jgi:hypothetical protein
MASLKFLELQRLLKELQFVESDYLYQSELIRQTDRIFLENVNSLLDRFPELKKLWIQKQEKYYIQSEISFDSENNKETVTESIVDVNVKRLYREIVKNTHPDKIKNTKLNELYIEATYAYETSDLITLYRVSSELLINLELGDDDLFKIRDKINQYKSQIFFLESTYTFKWLKSSDDEKDKIILKFIENKIK